MRHASLLQAVVLPYLLALPAIAATCSLTNMDIMKMVQAKVPQDTIIQKIVECDQQFYMFPEHLDALAKSGVPDEVIRAMAAKQAGAPIPRASLRQLTGAPMGPVASASALLSADTPSSNIPSEPGLYTVTAHGPVKIEGQAVSFERTGSMLTSAVTIGIKAAKINVQLPGAHSANVAKRSTEFFYRMSPEMVQQGAGIGDLVLLEMKVKGTRRQVETRASGLWRSSKGVSIKIQVETTRKELQPGLYLIKPAEDMKPGEYGFYLFRGNVLPRYFYDFSVKAD